MYHGILFMKNIKLLAVILLFCALAGIFASFLLAHERHFRDIARELKSDAGIISMTHAACGRASSFISCERVDSAPQSRLLSLPQTSWGMMYFLVILGFIVPVFVIGHPTRNAYIVFLFWIVVFGACYSLYMFAVSIIAIRALCPLCLVTYFATWIAVSFIAFYLWREKENPAKILHALRELRGAISLQRKVVLAAFLGLVLCAALPAGLFLDYYVIRLKEHFIAEKRNAVFDAIVEEFSRQSSIHINPSQACAMGNPAAPVTIVEFSDFLCPHCKKASEFIKTAASEFGDKVRVIFMNLPLESGCNSDVKKDVHVGSCLLAKGAICAARQSAFVAYMDHTFSIRPKNAGKEEMRQLAVFSGIDISAFESCIASYETELELQKQISEAHRLDIHSTPTIFINGKQLKSWGDVEIIKRAIKKALEATQ